MSLKFYLGGSGTGKSRRLYEEVNKWAADDPGTNYLFIVPDQYTMHSQIKLVTHSEFGGIMNIEVLSFLRLAHRVFEETGFMTGKSVLDDTGKSLILRAVADSVKDDMPYLGGNLNKIGFIHEIKSIISEFKQYDISPEGVDSIIEASKGHGLLSLKLKDIKTVYEAFNKHISSDFITTEETMSLLTEAVTQSELVKGSVVILDGFTGFTPVQYRLIQQLMHLTSKVIVSITIDIKSSPYSITGEQELFYLSKKTILDLQRLAQEINIIQEDDVLLDKVYRFSDDPELEFLQRNIFRYPCLEYDKEPENIVISECNDIRSEIRDVCIRIKKLVLEEGMQYRDIAVISADLESYADGFKEAGNTYDIPFFIDMNTKLRLNPFVEFIMSALMIVRENCSYRSVMHFLRSGLAGFAYEDIDGFDNYILAHGIKGKGTYGKLFTAPPAKTVYGEAAMSEEDIAFLKKVNEIREELMSKLLPLFEKLKTASDHSRAIMQVVMNFGVEDKLLEMKKEFEETGQLEKASEYGQVYALITDLFGQIEKLLGERPISLEEFIKITESGIDEIDIGNIPGGVDRVIVGDITRSRFSDIKVLFLMGANDGNIPLSNSKGGIISDIDREFLKEQEIELSPTPREQIYTQRLYLYMIMSKPSSKLFISYCRSGNGGNSMKESYLIPMICDIFPKLKKLYPDRKADAFEGLVGNKDALILYSDALREYASGSLTSVNEAQMSALGAVLKEDNMCDEIAQSLINTAFFEYKHQPLSKELAGKLYGEILTNSVSRLEQFAACQYAHFLKYGLRLKERDEFSFERKDLGTVYHGILSEYSERIQKAGYDWTGCPEDVSDRILSETVDDVCTRYGSSILYGTFSNRRTIKKIAEIMTRTVKTIKRQLAGGSFVPEGFETEFSREIELGGGSKMKITGRIDRIDICKKDEKLFVKIIDYKSGQKDMELDSLLYGLQLQQPVYMMEALKKMAAKYPESIPQMAAMLYYHIDDPIISGMTPEVTDEEISGKIDSDLRPTGLVNDDRKIIESLDGTLSEDAGGVTSTVIPVSVNKDGELSRQSKVISEDKYRTLSEYTDMLTKAFAEKIINGDKEIAPSLKEDGDACKYCAYADVCPYDEKCAGFAHRNLKKLSDEEALTRMSEECR
ncbi:MAG: PD-(D/E)XK nuclease family protein [Lachnospiraceae bacterium]|nr:PD-(D/E)XK nuclease family protein [Lachnospiraceae bacterium]